ncbi:fasciclin [Acetobacter tropicalis]|nr:fasciclin [Acetobacter tropicalis]KAA8388910.1 fasciclin [Acetobacter tropicalis]
MILWETIMRHPRAWAAHLKTAFFTPAALKPFLLGTALLGLTGLSACQSKARQDVFKTPTGTCAYMMPTISGTRTYEPRKVAAADSKNAPDSAIAYADPETPAFCDRPLSETVQSSIELADYTHGLTITGLLPILQKDGPFTVFGIPNAVLEQYNTQTGGKLTAPENTALFKEILSYSIVKGKWSVPQLRAAATASPTHSVGLPTLNGHILSAWVDQPTGQIILGNGEGMTSRLWVTGIPQSNGMLYFTQSLILPPVAPPATPPTPRPHGIKVHSGTARKAAPVNKQPLAVAPASQPLPGHRAPSAGLDSLSMPPSLQGQEAASH